MLFDSHQLIVHPRDMMPRYDTEQHRKQRLLRKAASRSHIGKGPRRGLRFH